MTSLALQSVGKFDSGDTRKVLIRAFVQGNQNAEDLGKVLIVYCAFDFDKYRLVRDYHKKQMLMRAVIQGLKNAQQMQGWGIDLQIAKLEQDVAGPLENIFAVGRRVYNSSRSRLAQVHVYHDLDVARVVARVWHVDQRDYFFEPVFFQSEPHEFYFTPRLGKLEWIDDQTLRLSPKSSAAHNTDPISVSVE